MVYRFNDPAVRRPRLEEKAVIKFENIVDAFEPVENQLMNLYLDSIMREAFDQPLGFSAFFASLDVAVDPK